MAVLSSGRLHGLLTSRLGVIGEGRNGLYFGTIKDFTQTQRNLGF